MPSGLGFCCLGFCPCLAICLSLLLSGLAVSDSGLTLLQACVSALLGDQLSPRGMWAEAQSQLRVPTETGRIFFQTALFWELWMGTSEDKCSSYLCSQVCQHSCETSFLPARSGYRELWHRVNSVPRQKLEGSCLRVLLGSCVQRAPWGFLFDQKCEQKWWCHLCSWLCHHFWETSSLPPGSGYRKLWYRVSSRHRQKPESTFFFCSQKWNLFREREEKYVQRKIKEADNKLNIVSQNIFVPCKGLREFWFLLFFSFPKDAFIGIVCIFWLAWHTLQSLPTLLLAWSCSSSHSAFADHSITES